MKSEATRIWRLGLPDDWEPDDYWCVSFQIPAGDQYVDALSAALGLLTLSKTFERDETHEGARTVAQTWKRALMINPMSVNQDCVIVPTPPIPDEAAAADASAAIFTVFMQYLVTELNTCAPSPEYCGACVDDLFASLVPYGASEGVRGALQSLCAALNNNPSTRDEYETDCPYTEEWEAITDNINNNPYDWLNKLSEWMFDQLNGLSDDILYQLNVVGGLMGGGMVGFIQDNGGIPSGGGATFGSVCQWTQELDLTTDPWGFTAMMEVHDGCGDVLIAGNYVTSQGWRSTLVHSGTCALTDEGVIITISTIPSHLTHAEITGVCTLDSDVEQYLGGAADGVLLHNAENFPVGTTTVTWDGDADFTTLRFFMSQSAVVSGAHLTLTHILLQGEGINPFL